MTIRPPRNRLAAVLLTAVVIGFSALTLAGEMEPPGVPAPTMKPLSMVEPRTPIHAADLPLTITTPGSYYLAEDVPTAAGGITIDVSNVTIDLMGFSLCGGTGSAVHANASANNVTVQNGFVCNWTACAIRLEFNDESIVQNIHAHQNHAGICVGPRSVVTRCVVSESNYQGFVLQYGSVITNSTANNNSQEGFKCQPSGGGGACTITDCVAYENGSHGFFASEASSIEGCVAIRNQGDGINAGIASLVRGCTSRQNYGDGIEVYTESSVMDNNSVANGWTTSDGAGIHVTGFTNRIEGNNCAQNTRGLDVDMGSNVIIGNSVGMNTTNFDIVAGNTWSSATPDVAGPWDNLEY